MHLVPVTQSLSQAGFNEPTLRALIPNQDNYTVMLLQPKGDIEADANGVRHHNRGLAHQQTHAFLDATVQSDADLVIAPEYCVPWTTLIDAIKAGVVPAAGAIWVLGCESIRYTELEEYQRTLADTATVVFETLQPEPSRFLDPLAYVFQAPSNSAGSPPKLVMLIQFKTCAMGDKAHFEVNGLQKGSSVYQFGAGNGSVRLTSFICSDAFALKDSHATDMYDRGLVIHIQLNPNPRQEQYAGSRKRLFDCANGFTELICLNWAADVVERHNSAPATPWKNIGGSAWYLDSDDFDSLDTTLCANHKNGLYYTWLDYIRSHALFFNYLPAIFVVTATKVFHRGVPGSLSYRRGPQLTEIRMWDDTARTWASRTDIEDGFSSVVGECGDARVAMTRCATANPFIAERIFALCAGRIGHSQTWYFPKQLDSCHLDSNEIVRRMTFCQDNAPAAVEFRTARFSYCKRLWTILETPAHLPPSLADLQGGFELHWTQESPHQNLRATSGSRKRATAIYMGETVTRDQVEAVAKKVAEFLHRASDADSSLDARQRLAVWYRDDGGAIQRLNQDRYLRFDEPRSESEFDIARDT